MCYFGMQYEKVMVYFANHFIQGLDVGALLVHNIEHQLCVITSRQSIPAQVRIDGLDWIYASQAAAIGVVLSTCASAKKQVIWMTIAVLTMAFAHIALLVFVTAELSRHYFEFYVDIVAFGPIALKIYRIGTPLMLAGIWLICSGEALFYKACVKHHRKIDRDDEICEKQQERRKVSSLRRTMPSSLVLTHAGNTWRSESCQPNVRSQKISHR